MNEYQVEQLEALRTVRRHPDAAAGQPSIKTEIERYLAFRDRTAGFHQAHFEPFCAEKCYFSNASACCSKDGIIVFFADVVINALASSAAELDLLEQAIANPVSPGKCIFLTRSGCLWRIKPIVCEMFVCRAAKTTAFENDPRAAEQWKEFEKERKSFTWPDRPVLFEHLERLFIDIGAESTLMHIHNSPGLLRIKKKRQAATRLSGKPKKPAH